MSTMGELLKQIGLGAALDKSLPFERGGKIYVDAQRRTLELYGDDVSESRDIELDFKNDGDLISSGVGENVLLGGTSFHEASNPQQKPLMGFHFHPVENNKPSADDFRNLSKDRLSELILTPSGKGRIWFVKNRNLLEGTVNSSKWRSISELWGGNLSESVIEKTLGYVDIDFNFDEDSDVISDRAMKTNIFTDKAKILDAWLLNELIKRTATEIKEFHGVPVEVDAVLTGSAVYLADKLGHINANVLKDIDIGFAYEVKDPRRGSEISGDEIQKEFLRLLRHKIGTQLNDFTIDFRSRGENIRFTSLRILYEDLIVPSLSPNYRNFVKRYLSFEFYYGLLEGIKRGQVDEKILSTDPLEASKWRK